MALRITQEIKIGIGLDEKEITELKSMYLSGDYTIKEMADWFGLTPYKVKKYLVKGELL